MQPATHILIQPHARTLSVGACNPSPATNRVTRKRGCPFAEQGLIHSRGRSGLGQERGQWGLQTEQWRPPEPAEISLHPHHWLPWKSVEICVEGCMLPGKLGRLSCPHWHSHSPRCGDVLCPPVPAASFNKAITLDPAKLNYLAQR